MKWADNGPIDELAAYLESLPEWLDITVVDGSEQQIFEQHRRHLPHRARHLRPAPAFSTSNGTDTGTSTSNGASFGNGNSNGASFDNGASFGNGNSNGTNTGNGKTFGVLTGIALARHERIVLADDDVRYRSDELERIVTLLDDADLVRPQNYFSKLPWHARWDTSRTLLNRAFGSDYPGTLALRRSVLGSTNGYSPDALFENLELIRTIQVLRGREIRADNLFVARIPPSTRHFLGQRVRQAYDSFAQPGRLAVELSILPFILASVLKPERLLAGALAVVVMAEAGRRRNDGGAVFPPGSALWAPLWVLERGICSWAAVASRYRGGVRYSGGRLKLAGHSRRWLRKNLEH
ncbi:hypothetical protein IWX65_000463 [Arthrobacter sp. CAN_A214]|uniref:glycosyltransferase family 2 protein n=1 Tax=Arthrobacter sp. CAN_A214 TaxID=2787720 RepID=UPI0018C979C3